MNILSLIFFSEWSNLDVAWTSAFSLIVVTSVLGNVMVLKLVFFGYTASHNVTRVCPTSTIRRIFCPDALDSLCPLQDVECYDTYCLAHNRWII